MRIPTIIFSMLLLAGIAPKNAFADKGTPVTLTENAATYTLSNGIVTAVIKKADATMPSIKYKGLQMVDNRGAYWDVLGSPPDQPKAAIRLMGTPTVCTITQNPATNSGEMGEVNIRFPYSGQAGALPFDIDVRYTLRRGDQGVYAWTIVGHDAKYPPFNMGESELIMKLNPGVFDFLSVDSARQKLMIKPIDWVNGTRMNVKEARMMHSGPHAGEVEHKYDYNGLLVNMPAYGWSSTTKDVGMFIVNPSMEYINGGPVENDYQGHIDGKDVLPADPTLLFVWHTSHYGGKPAQINAGDNWHKVVGPFLIYFNEGASPNAMWHDALTRAEKEKKAWPYAWANAPGYAHAAERGSATGHIEVHDPQAPKATAAHAWVGLAHAPYEVNIPGCPEIFDWQLDGKYYQYWAQADAHGNFTIPNARPGTYTFYAFCDGILGEYSQANVTIEAGKTIDLGKLNWVPVRNGKQLWDIGIPNRSASEFKHGDHFWQWGLYNLYPQEFPNDVDYIIGKSNYHTDWNYAQPQILTANGSYANTRWKIEFTRDKIVKGTCTLRIAICGARGGPVDVLLNGQSLGSTGALMESGVMHRDGIRASLLIVKDIKFDASRLQAGNNVITLVKEGRDWPDGVLYDYLRLELDEHQ